MKHLVRKHAIVLAALLQLLPIVRNFVTNPAATSTFAIILRWTVGATTAVGAYDSVSASSVVVFVTPTNFTGNVGVYFTNNVAITNNQDLPGAYFNIFNQSGTVFALNITSGMTTTNCMPPGLTFKMQDANNGNGIKPIFGAIYGTPTAPVTNLFVHFQCGLAGYGAADTTNYFTILPTDSASPPILTNQPASQTNLVSSNATFSVTAGGTVPLSYQWFFNTNTALPGATNASLTLTNLQLGNAGYYRVAVTNSAGSTNSLNALLTVWQPPVITNQPVSVTNVAGGAASFSVVAGGTPAVSYQWRFNANTALPNATAPVFSLATIRASQAGIYSVVITNSAGSLTSAPASLVVTAPAPPPITAAARVTGGFQFTFNPVIGLTNSITTNDTVNGGSWVVMTNVPPPTTTNPVTVTDTITGTNRFYRVEVIP